MKLLALMPVYKSMNAKAVISLTNMIANIYNKGDHLTVMYSMLNNVGLARNGLFNVALREYKDVDYILSLDSDHTYDAKDVYSLIDKMEKNKLPMLSAAYRARGSNKLAHLKFVKDGVPELIDRTPDLKGIHECYAIGLGFVVMKPEFLKDLHTKLDGNLFNRVSAHTAGEDVFFCELARKHGYKVCYDADCRIGHIFEMVYK